MHHRRYSSLAAFLSLVFLSSIARGQIEPTFYGTKIQIEGFVDYTTSARIYPSSRDADPSINSAYNSFSGFLSPGGDIRVVLSRSNVVGLTIQYLAEKQTIYSINGYNEAGEYVGVPVNDGFSLWLIELNGYFNIPILGGKWNLYLGGGPALYLGRRNLEIGNSEANTPLVATGGIQVAAGVTFKFTDNLGIRSEMKFRSPEFNTASSFNSSSITYDGLRVTLPKTQYGKVNLDGDDFTLGLFWEL
jgi:opacity protein-like surface antigen